VAVSTRAFGRKLGDTRPGPFSMSSRCCSSIIATPPMAEPTTTPTRSGRVASRPASAAASSAAATASSTLRSMRLASLRDTARSGSKSRTSPAMRTGYGEGSKAAMVSIPL
jgi:hypothetical protein